jgi:hypothetical protein
VKQIFSPLHSVQTDSEAYSTPLQGVKRLGGEADHPLPSSDKVKNGGAIHPLPHTSSWRGA